MPLFEERKTIKPNEYPVQGFIDAIINSHWNKNEYNYTSDIQDYNVYMNDIEKDVSKKCMLSVSTVEVKVKPMRASIYQHIPKPEIASVGFTFGFNEVIHQQFYSHLLELLKLDNEFEKILDEEVIKKRIEYIDECMKGEFVRKLTFFTLFIENVSLFSQFLILMSMNKHKMYLKGMANGIMASTLEEAVHAEFGTFLINTIKKEYKTMVDKNDIISMCEQARVAEYCMVDWIFEKGELEYLSKDIVKNYIDYRIYKGLSSIGIDIDKVELPEELERFEVQLKTTSHVDFFNKKSPNYSKKTKSITAEDLF